MDLQLKGKRALVTGSTAGIGYAIAQRLAAEGAQVWVNGRMQERVDGAVEKIKAATGNAEVQGVIADFADTNQIAALINQVPEVDILINNVAVFEPKEFAAITDDDWLRFFEVNVMSGIRLSRAYFEGMLNRNWGRIIFISSESALQIPAEMIHYGVSKTAQLGVARGLAELTKGTDVTVNTVLPGPTLSEGVGSFIDALAANQQKSVKEVEDDFFVSMRPTSLLQRFITPDEVANTVTYLSSPLAAATNGAAIRVDGGVIKTAV
jgi:NAD(P)-dependent dehydrogenase (short-subunit alcohol dehydrogenase family)